MRTWNQSLYGSSLTVSEIERQERIKTARDAMILAPSPPVPTADDLEQGEQLALLKLRRSTTAAAIYNAIIENGAAHPDRRYFSKLVAKNLATKNESNEYHSITVAGELLAHKLIQQISTALNIHHPTFGRRIEEPAVACSCGWTAEKFLRRKNRNVMAAFERHKYTAEQIHNLKAAMKPPRVST